MFEGTSFSKARAGRGLVIVYTGDGKGKTTAALGMALRAVGHGMHVLMIQFIKGSHRYGETMAAKYLPGLDIRSLGKGFIFSGLSVNELEKHRAAVTEAWETAKDAAFSGRYDMLILDELNYVVGNAELRTLLSVEELLEFLKKKPAGLHVIITGRNAPDELIEAADLVTEMKEVKHPFRLGIKATKGIEF